MIAWEYRTCDLLDNNDNSIDDEALDVLGMDGWELVVVVQVGPSLRAIFKRPTKEGSDFK